MPWSAGDASRHDKSADTSAKRKRWAAIANHVRQTYLAKGRPAKAADRLAIMTANARTEASEPTVVMGPHTFPDLIDTPSPQTARLKRTPLRRPKTPGYMQPGGDDPDYDPEQTHRKAAELAAWADKTFAAKPPVATPQTAARPPAVKQANSAHFTAFHQKLDQIRDQMMALAAHMKSRKQGQLAGSQATHEHVLVRTALLGESSLGSPARQAYRQQASAVRSAKLGLAAPSQRFQQAVKRASQTNAPNIGAGIQPHQAGDVEIDDPAHMSPEEIAAHRQRGLAMIQQLKRTPLRSA